MEAERGTGDEGKNQMDNQIRDHEKELMTREGRIDECWLIWVERAEF